jgi:hypothetical protein
MRGEGGVPQERRHTGALEEEMSKVLLRVGAEGTVLIGERATEVKEAPGPDVAMPEDPEEDAHLDRGGGGAAGGLQHLL